MTRVVTDSEGSSLIIVTLSGNIGKRATTLITGSWRSLTVTAPPSEPSELSDAALRTGVLFRKMKIQPFVKIIEKATFHFMDA